MERLLTAVENLASPADRQKAYLVSLGVAPSADELALEFDDAMSGVSAEAALSEKLDAIGNQLAAMSGEENSHLWQMGALVKSPEWATVRTLAAEALVLLQLDSKHRQT
jgi:hypothetical protein